MNATCPGCGQELCPGCGSHLFERDPRQTAVRRCQECWWLEQRRLHKMGGDVHPLARWWIENPPKRKG